MPGRAKSCPAGYPIHVIRRDNNRQAFFTSDADLAANAHWLAEDAERFDVAIHAAAVAARTDMEGIDQPNPRHQGAAQSTSLCPHRARIGH